jgi:hypothetical protein
MKRLSIKNVKFSESLSEETNAFTADVYLDNVKFAHAKNSGIGGATDIHAYPNFREQMKQAEEYAKSLPPIKTERFELDMDLELAVDTLFEEWLLARDMKKGILFKTPNGGTMILKYNKAISTILKSPKGIAVIQEKVKELKAEGNVILNTNFNGLVEV